MSPPICIPCGLMMRCKRIGQPIVICDDIDLRQPDKLAFGDMWRCPGCHSTVAVGLGRPVECTEDRFARELAAVGDDAVRVRPHERSRIVGDGGPGQ